MKKIFLFILFLTLILGCEKAEQLISPYHYSLLQKPSNFQIEKFDTTGGKYKIFLKWTVNDSTNIRNFEIHRSIKNPDNFRIVPPAQKVFAFVDSTMPSFVDTLTLYYKIFPNGYKTDPKTNIQTAFLGPESDIQTITLRKKK